MYRRFFMKILPFISSLWQERWVEEVDNKLHAIMPRIDEKYYSGCTNRKDEVAIIRLRIGHTRLTHSFRMENRPHPPLCDLCEGNHELTVKHILIECSFLKIIRRRHCDVTDLNQLFKTVSSKIVITTVCTSIRYPLMCDCTFNCVWNVIMFSVLSALQGCILILPFYYTTSILSCCEIFLVPSVLRVLSLSIV